MPGKARLVGILLLASVVTGGAEHSGTTALVLQVRPEARLDPQQIDVHFRVSADGLSDVSSQTANVTAWVRSLPGRPIRVSARLAAWNGPDGPAPAGALRWTGVSIHATAGAQAANCSSGIFQEGASHDLVLGWQQSGILTCAMKLELAAPRDLPPGLYSGSVNLALSVP
jgi:hypothetical protein